MKENNEGCQLSGGGAILGEPKDYCLFSIIINDKPYEVWRRKEKHNLGIMNGCPDDWWLKYGDRWVPYIDKCVHRPCWDVSYVQNNYTKCKWGDIDIRSTGHVDIFCNKVKVYEFGARDYAYGLARASSIITILSEHTFRFSEPEKEIGRKIYYFRQPAIIKSLLLEQGCIMIEKEGEGGFDLSQPWDKEIDWPVSEWHGQKVIKDDILSDNIYWFRK